MVLEYKKTIGAVLTLIVVIQLFGLYINPIFTLFPIENVTHNSVIHDLSPYNPDELFWFVHVSDIHICEQDNVECTTRSKDFSDFCTTTIQNISPAFVIITGDLTNSSPNLKKAHPPSRDIFDKRINIHRTYQSEREWDIYFSAAHKANQLIGSKPHPMFKNNEISHKDVFVYDIGGNHDRFGVGNFAQDHYFETHSTFGGKQLFSNKKQPEHTFSFQYKLGPNKVYNFVGVDLSPRPGLFSPLNFFGVFNDATSKSLDTRLSGFDNNIVFGHYPQSVVTATSDLLYEVLGKYNCLAYLSGHLHTIFNLIPSMVAVHPISNHLEAEVGDFKQNRRFRVYAIDNGVLTFSDGFYNKNSEEPIMLITNIKDPLYLSKHEKAYYKNKLESVNLIQILLFPDVQKIISARLVVDNKKTIDVQHERLSAVTKNVYRFPLYDNELSDASVVCVEIEYEKDKIISKCVPLVEHVSSYSVNRPTLLAKLMLFTNFTQLARSTFFLLYFISIFSLLAVFWLPIARKYKVLSAPSYWDGVINMRAKSPLLYYSFCLVSLYMLFGPWVVGEITDGRFGLICFDHITILSSTKERSLFTVLLEYAQGESIEVERIFTADPTLQYSCITMFFTYIPLLLYTIGAHSGQLSSATKIKLGSSILVTNGFVYFFFFWCRIVRVYGRYTVLVSPLGFYLYFVTLILIAKIMIGAMRRSPIKQKE